MPSDRVTWGRIVAVFIRLGWRPPPLKPHQAQRLIDDIQRIGGNATTRAGSLNLTALERTVLARAAHGDTVLDVAARNGRSPETVKAQHKTIKRKLGARNVTHAVAIAIDEGLIRSDTGWQEAA